MNEQRGKLMAVLDRTRDIAVTARDTAQRQARIARRRLKARQLRSKIRGQHALIGQHLAPLVRSGQVAADQPDVRRAADEAQALTEELEATHREIDAIQAEGDGFVSEEHGSERRDGPGASPGTEGHRDL